MYVRGCTINKINKIIYIYTFSLGRSLETIFFFYWILSSNLTFFAYFFYHLLRSLKFHEFHELSRLRNANSKSEFEWRLFKILLGLQIVWPHSTRYSFMNKTKNQSIKNLLSFAVSWVKVVKNRISFFWPNSIVRRPPLLHAYSVKNRMAFKEIK